MLTYKMICSDMDGTLLSTRGGISDYTAAVLRDLKDQLDIVLVSARMPSGMRFLQQQLEINKQPIICYNGALVLQGDKVLKSETIDFDTLLTIYKLTQPLHIKIGWYYKDEWYTEQHSERVEKEIIGTHTHPTYLEDNLVLNNWSERNVSAHKLMLMCTTESADELFPQLIERFHHELQIYRSNDTLIEISSNKASKLEAIELVLQNRDFNVDQVIAFGDNYNDIAMIKGVGHGVAVANGRKELIAVADAVTDSCKNNGVAQYLSQLFQ